MLGLGLALLLLLLSDTVPGHWEVFGIVGEDVELTDGRLGGPDIPQVRRGSWSSV